MKREGVVLVPTVLAGMTVMDWATNQNFLPPASAAKAMEVGPQMQDMLSQMQAVQQDAAQMQAAQQAASGQQSQGGQSGQGNQPGQGQGVGPYGQNSSDQQGQGAGDGGRGEGGGGLPYAPAPFGVKQEVSPSFNDEAGQVIASTLIEADALKGESKAAVRDIAASETTAATDDVDTQRVSRRAQKAVRDYFNSMARDAGGEAE